MKAWMTKCILLAAVAVAIGQGKVRAADNDTSSGITFTKDVLPILQNHCVECHRPGGNDFSGMVAPMPLRNYEEVRPWAKSIVKQVSSKHMPPWYASPQFHGVFELERGLSDAQIDTVTKWVQTGAAQGKPEDAPAPVVYPSKTGWTYGEPDIIIKMPEPYWIGDDVIDVQPSTSTVLTTEQLSEDKWIHWIEFRGGSSAVHHGGAYVTPLGPDGKPAADPLCGGKIIGTAPGDGPDFWPDGYGKLVRKGSRITFGLHYHKEKGPGTGVWDQSEIAIKWHTVPVKYAVRAQGISSRGWEIPPNKAGWKVGAAHTFERESAVINMMPHMHYRGKYAKYEAFYPDGKSELLLEVPKYDFNWQMTYTYKNPKILPAGTRVEVTMVYDNSPGNTYVSDPQRPITWGSMTDDEMNIGWLEYANVQPIEDIVKEFSQKKNVAVQETVTE